MPIDVGLAKTTLRRSQLHHLQRLTATWGLLADLSFADLLLFTPSAQREDEDGEGLLVLDQVRPATGPTLYESDWVGTTVVLGRERPMVIAALESGEAQRGEVDLAMVGERVNVHCVPVRCEGEVIAVMSRESAPSVSRTTGRLATNYRGLFDRACTMIEAGSIPFDSAEGDMDKTRITDGVTILDADRAVEFSSPNALSNFRRFGIHQPETGRRLAIGGLDTSLVEPVFRTAKPRQVEVSGGADVTLRVQCFPLLENGFVTGGLVASVDISELKRLDRLLTSKDATIREIHHRVKNNLQTISSLLRIQGRRTSSAEAKQAIDESVRRIGSIAVVHEILAADAGDDVGFHEIARPLIRTVNDGLALAERNVSVRILDHDPTLPAETATSLAVILSELVQNAAEHGYPVADGAERTGGVIEVGLSEEDGGLQLTVVDDGIGPPPGFDLDADAGLGLSIVKTLADSELGGSLQLVRQECGTVARLDIPIAPIVRAEPAVGKR